MAERLSYELTDILGEYIVEALRAEDEIFWSFTETQEKGAASVQLVNLKKQEVVDKLKIVTEAEKEKNLKLYLLTQLSQIFMGEWPVKV